MNRRCPSPSAGKVVVLGVLGQAPFAGIVWQVLHYLEAFRRLGWEVHYVEDTGEWPYDPIADTVSPDCGYALNQIERSLARCGLERHWAYRSAAHDDAVYGPAAAGFADLFADADLLVNLTGATVLRDEHLKVPRRLYLETDPVLPQIEVAQGRDFTIEMLAAHTHWATFGENIGAPDCGVPATPFAYIPTRQPVVIDWWHGPEPGPCYTTVASWRQDHKDVEWDGEQYTWSKDVEFRKVLDLPARVEPPLELALACDDDADVRLLREHGWRVVDATPLSLDADRYRIYLLASRAEFTVAKDQNVRLRSGWFSDRSATYLAAGRPVVVQDTAFDCQLPTGEGLLAFRDLAEAAAAVGEVEGDYGRHGRAAAAVAREYFEAVTVVGDLLARLS